MDLDALIHRDGARVLPRVGGGVKIDLAGGYQNAVIARRNSDGSISTSCVDTAEDAQEFLGQAAPVGVNK